MAGSLMAFQCRGACAKHLSSASSKRKALGTSSKRKALGTSSKRKALGTSASTSAPLHSLQPNHYGIDVPSSKWKTESVKHSDSKPSKKTMRCFFFLCLAAFVTRAAVAADPAADLASFSVFNNV